MVGGDEIEPETFEVRIDVAADVLAAGAVVDGARPWQSELRRAAGLALEEAEILGVARAGPGDAARDFRDAPRGAVAMALGFAPALLLGQFDGHPGDAGMGEGVRVGAAAEFAVGDHLQARVLL